MLADRDAHDTRRSLVPVAGRILVLFAGMLLLLYAVVARFARRVAGPLLAIDDASGAIAQGRFPEAQALARLFESPIAEIRSMAYRFLTMRDALAYRDPLTGLPNRALFLDRLAQAVAQARRDRQRLAVLRLGLDRFRLVLDTLGHAAGDALLVAVAARLREPVREADTVARLSADEFVVLVRQVHQDGDGARVARKLLDAVRAPFVLESREIVVTASVGLAVYPGDAEHEEALLQNADAAMHRAKEAGGDTYRLYTPTMNDRALEQLALETALRRAVGQGEFEVHYQPIVDLRAGRLSGMEALVRWRHPERGLLAPAHFIALAEASGLIVPIGSFVLREAASQVKSWRDRGHGPLRCEVNLSARQFQKADLLDEVARCLEETGLPPEALELEITESTAMHDVAASVVDPARAPGARRAHLPGRLRHRLLVPELPEDAARGHGQARPVVRARRHDGPRRRRHRHRGAHPGPEPGPGGDRRGRGEPRAARFPPRPGLRHHAGLLLQPAAGGRRDGVAAAHRDGSRPRSRLSFTLLGGLSPAQFLRRHWQRKPLLIRGAFPGFADPLSPEELAGLACEPDVESRLVLERGPAAPGR